MNITLTGNKIAQDTKFLAFEKNNGVDVINITVDTDESWIYKLDVKYPNKCCSGEQLYNIINLTRNGNVCTVVLTKDMLPFTGKYMMQLRAISGDKVYHSDTFDCWVKYSIEPASTYNPVPSEFYQIEQNVTEMNNHPPKPGQNGYWLVWDITTSQYKESDIPLPDGMLPEVTADTSGKYLSNDGKKAYWAEVQAGTEGKIDKIEVNNVEQPIIDKTVNIAVPTKTSDLSNDSGYITNEALNSYATKAELPTKVSQLENDSKFINESALDGYAKTYDIPTKTSQLNNDSGFITDAALTGYAKTTDIPTKTSQLDNDSHYITASEAPVQSVNSKTGAVQLNASDVSAIPSTLTGTAGQVLTKTADGQEWKDVDIPTALPNPNALTFTGAVTGSYDGSAPLEVAIPSGEGGTGGGGDVFELIGEATSSGVSDATGLTIPFDGSLYKTIVAYAYNLPAGNKKRIIIRNKKVWYDGSPLGWNEVYDTYLPSMTNMNNTWGFFGVAIDVCGKLFTLGAAEANTNSGHGYFRFWPQSGALPTLSLSDCKFISLDCNSNSEKIPDGCSLIVWGVRK